VLLDPIVDLHAGRAQPRQDGVQVPDAVVDHRLLLARPVVGLAVEDRPDRLVAGRGGDGRTAVVLELEAELLGVPRTQPVQA
jgi:hypothetical protein